MPLRIFLAALAAFFILAVGSAGATEPSLDLVQPAPVYGQEVTFSATYPKEATRKVGRRQMSNPNVDLSCYQDGVRVFWTILPFDDDGPLGSDRSYLEGHTSYPVSLSQPFVSNEIGPWEGGAATCHATLYYFGQDELIHFLSNLTFEVGA